MTPERPPKAWIDEGSSATMFRGDVSKHEVLELSAMLEQAFKAGMKRAIEQLRPDNSGPTA
jgi:hypothetical protein